MSSDRPRTSSLGLVALLGLAGCAAFTRGETWDEETDGEATAGPMTTTSTSTSGSPPPTTTGESDSDDTTGDDASSGGSTGSAPTGPRFADDVLPLLVSGCERCHNAAGEASHTEFLLVDDAATDYDTTLAFVNVGSPSSSQLLSKGAGIGHTGGVVYDDRSPQYETILEWIEQGANP